MVRGETLFFFTDREKSGNSVSSHVNSKFYMLLVKSQGCLYLTSYKVWGGYSSIIKLIMAFLKFPAKEFIISVALLRASLPKNLSRVVSENWFMVSEKSKKPQGTVFAPISDITVHMRFKNDGRGANHQSMKKPRLVSDTIFQTF